MSRKRGADFQISKENDGSSAAADEPANEMRMATPEELAKRTIYRLKPRTTEPAGTGGLFAGISTSMTPGGSASSKPTSSFAALFGKAPVAASAPAEKKEAEPSSSSSSTTAAAAAPAAAAAVDGASAGSSVSFAAPKPISIEPRAGKPEAQAKPAPSTVFAAPEKTVTLEPRGGKTAEKETDAPANPDASAAAASSPEGEKGAFGSFNFTAPPAFGATFGKPSVGLFPPLRNNFDSLTSFAVPEKPQAKRAGAGAADGFSNLAKDENEMSKTAKLNEATAFGSDAAADDKQDAAKLFAPARPTYIQPEAAKLLAEPSAPSVTGEEDETTILTLPVLLKELRDQKWVERGSGTLKLNKPNKGGCHRLLMWRDLTFQSMLNQPVSPAIFKLPATEATPRAMMFVVVDEGKVRTLSFVLAKSAPAEADMRTLRDAIKDSLGEAEAADNKKD
ncbi:hypothetical protein DIPPA_21887 [Diplonema papillatum]|nr:hypothetical protein DIPPA_21887 [Diplonema papillatum]